MTAIIIDDEVKGRVALSQKLKEYCPEVELTGEAQDGEEGLALIERVKPEIVFLDIEMPRMNGFELLSRLERKNFHLIFTTAYDQYAIKAIRFAAFDYLLKPVGIEELRTAVRKLVYGQHQESTEQRLEVLEHNLRNKTAMSKITIPTMEGLLFFNIGDIIHVEAQSNYTVFSFVNHPKLTVSKTMKEFESLLPAETFFRCHRSHIINLNFIKRYIKGDGGQIEMQNGEVAEVARSKKDEFLALIGN